jgi:cobalt/nickel transport system permease protein
MDFDKEYFNLGFLDTLSYKDTVIHRLNARTKVIATFAFIVTVVSFPKYEITGLIPFFLPCLVHPQEGPDCLGLCSLHRHL